MRVASADGAADLVTVVVPALDEADSIGACLDAILSQVGPPLEVVVVDGGSTDRTVPIVREYAGADARVRLVDNPGRTIPKALNLGLQAARGRWLVRIDAHSTIDPDYVRLAADHLRTGRWGGVGGRKDGVASTPVGRAVAAVLGSRFGVGNSVYHYGTSPVEVDHVPFGCYPTALAREVGGWDEALDANEDYEFDDRLRRRGHRLLFDPALRIGWQVPETVPGLFRKYRRYGRGKADVVALRPGSVKLRHLAAPALVVNVGLSMSLLLARRRAGLVLLAPYLLAVSFATVTTARRLDRAARPAVLPAFAAMHLGWGLGFWERYLHARMGWTRS